MTSMPEHSGEERSRALKATRRVNEESAVRDMRLPFIRAFVQFEASMGAVFDLIAHQDQHRNDLDSRSDHFKKKVRQWNPTDNDDTIQSIFNAALAAVTQNERTR